MTIANDKRKAFRRALKEGEFLLAPGIYDALSAKIAQDSGMNCLAMGGYAISASRLAKPDVGLLSLTQMTEALREIASATSIPVIADGDTGYGNPLNVMHTVELYEAAGASCVFFEDQVWPKRCGHMEGKQVIPCEDHVQKIRAACEARADKDTLIMARTDARAVNGLEDALQRAERYAEAGAEALFIEALRSREEMETALERFKGSGVYLFANMIEGGKTPIIPAQELKAMGFAGVFWSCCSLYAVAKTLKTAFTTIWETGTSDSFAETDLIEFSDFNRLVGLPEYLELSKKFQSESGK